MRLAIPIEDSRYEASNSSRLRHCCECSARARHAAAVERNPAPFSPDAHCLLVLSREPADVWLISRE